MMLTFTIHAVAAVLCVFLLLVPALAAETFTTEFGKRQIPVELIHRALQPNSNDLRNVDLSRVVYEIVDGNLVGFEVKLHLEEETVLRPPTKSDSLKYTMNGNERLLTPSLTVRQGKGYTFLHRASDERLVHVFGKDLNLKPLDTVYPDVFVNTLAMKPTREDATDSVAIANKFAVRNDIIPTPQNSTVRQTGSCAAGTPHVLELAVAFDNQFCALYSNDESVASTAIQTLVSQADEVYREFTCLSISLVHIEAHCNDPADPYIILTDFSLRTAEQDESLYIQQGFRDIWEETRTNVQRDAAYFFSGFDDGTNIAGRAGLGATCNRFAYGWSERLSLPVFTHEIGHIVGSDHTPDGIMIATGFTGGDIFFSQASIDMITTYVDSTTDGCLSASAASCDATCPGPCVDGQCIARFSSQAPAGVVPCSTNFRCVDSEVHFSTEYSFATDCPANFNYVSREASEAGNLDTFCCMAATESIASDVAPADYEYIQFTLNLPDGPRVFPEYIRDPPVIESRMLLRTELLPSCQLPSGSNPQGTPRSSPEPTEVPALTPVPTFEPQIPQPTPVVEPNAEVEPDTPSATASPSDPTSGGPTCGGALADSETFTCTSSTPEEFEVVFNPKLKVSVMVTLMQRGGMFKATLSASKGAKFRGVTARLSTDGSLRPDEIGAPVLVEDMPSEVTIEEDAFEMDLPAGASTCCGENLFFYVNLEVCQKKECVTRGLFRRQAEIRCAEPCATSPGDTIVPFSATNACPSCKQ